jgi:tRNA/tmRNA/rRNA uracil-C5-methylase (TrmA/RlmC/RlmD family)
MTFLPAELLCRLRKYVQASLLCWGWQSNRKGLDAVLLQQLCQKINGNQLYAEKPTLIAHLPRHTINWTNDVRTLIYVSCGFDALARDLDGLLTSNAGWKLDSATGYVLFPGSNHVETVVVLQR